MAARAVLADMAAVLVVKELMEVEEVLAEKELLRECSKSMVKEWRRLCLW